MEQNKQKILEKYGVKSPEEKETDLTREKELWEALLLAPEDEQTHKEYVGHVIRYGLLKEASRRYAPMIDDKDKYDIQTRRIARMYWKQIMNMMFMVPSGPAGKVKNPSLGYVATFIAVMAVITGVLAISFSVKYLLITFAGLLYLVPYIIFKVRQAKKKAEKKKFNQESM